MNKSKPIVFLVDVIISLVIPLFLLGVALEFTSNDFILTTSFLGPLVLLTWYAWHKPFKNLEYRRKKRPEPRVRKPEAEEIEKEVEKVEIEKVRAPDSLDKPLEMVEKRLVGLYNGKVESWWYDSDGDTNNDWHRVYLTLLPDGIVMAGSGK